jgi:hypothetical protein
MSRLPTVARTSHAARRQRRRLQRSRRPRGGPNCDHYIAAARQRRLLPLRRAQRHHAGYTARALRRSAAVHGVSAEQRLGAVGARAGVVKPSRSSRHAQRPRRRALRTTRRRQHHRVGRPSGLRRGRQRPCSRRGLMRQAQRPPQPQIQQAGALAAARRCCRTDSWRPAAQYAPGVVPRRHRRCTRKTQPRLVTQLRLPVVQRRRSCCGARSKHDSSAPPAARRQKRAGAAPQCNAASSRVHDCSSLVCAWRPADAAQAVHRAIVRTRPAKRLRRRQAQGSDLR